MAIIRKPTIRAGERPSVKYAASVAYSVSENGEGMLETVAEKQHELGKKYARAHIKSCGIRERDAKAAGIIYRNLLRELSVAYNIIEDTNKRFIVHTEACPFLEEWKTTGVDATRLCRSFGNSFIQGLCEGVNPELRYSVIKMMSRGSPYCKKRIELEPQID